MNEYIYSLSDKIKDAQGLNSFPCLFSLILKETILGVDFWKANFFPEESVDWDDFVPRLYKWIGKALPRDPTALGENPTAAQLANASLSQLQKLERQGIFPVFFTFLPFYQAIFRCCSCISGA